MPLTSSPAGLQLSSAVPCAAAPLTYETLSFDAYKVRCACSGAPSMAG